MTVVYFNLKRFWRNEDGSLTDLWKEIGDGSKRIEYRDFNDYWTRRLLTHKGRETARFIAEHRYRYDTDDMVYKFERDEVKVDTAIFKVGYTRYPRYVSIVTKIELHYDDEQYQIHFDNVTLETDPAQAIFCEGCPTNGVDCLCPNGVNDWKRCNYHEIYKKTGLWKETTPLKTNKANVM